MTRVVVLDLDGTLVDTPSAIVEAFTLALASAGAEPCEASAIRATIGLPLAQAFANLTGRPVDDAIVSRCAGQYQVLFRERIVPQAGRLLFPGVAAGLATLRDEGCVLAVATSKVHASAEAILRAAGLWDRFALVVGADQVQRPKPDPETGHVILRHLGVPADHAVMVGDTTHDLLMAKAAGMRSIAVTYGVHSREELESAQPTWIADTFGEVVGCVRDAAGEPTARREPRREPA